MTNFFLNYVFAPVVLILGLIGNPIGLIVVGRKKMGKIGPVLVYKFLFTLHLLNVINKWIK